MLLSNGDSSPILWAGGWNPGPSLPLHFWMTYNKPLALPSIPKSWSFWTQTEELHSGNSCVLLIVKGLEASGIPPPALQCSLVTPLPCMPSGCVFPAGNPKNHLPRSQHRNLTFHTGVRAISWHFYISHCSKRYGQDLQSTFRRGIICI